MPKRGSYEFNRSARRVQTVKPLFNGIEYPKGDPDDPLCLMPDPNGEDRCTRNCHLTGPHVNHNSFGKEKSRWDNFDL